METIILYCKKCGLALTKELLELSESKIIWEDNTNVVQKSHYVLFKNKSTNRNSILVAIDDYFLKTNPNNKDEGCCGNSNPSSFNKICSNGHEVATEISDCWTGFYIEFDLMKVIIKENKLIYAK